MSAAEAQIPFTALRSLEMRSRQLSLDEQMGQCIGLLELPEAAIGDLIGSVAQVACQRAQQDRFELATAPADHREGLFYPSRELFVQGDGCSFTCLATDVEFREDSGARGEAESELASGVEETRPIDYAAVTCEARPFPVLGFAQSADSESAYALLLRAISTVIELVRPRRLDALDREIYRGLLGVAPLFDLALVLWDDDREDDPRRPLCELTRDLAELLKQSLASESRFPPVLNNIVCLRMNPHRFDARLRFVWRV